LKSWRSSAFRIAGACADQLDAEALERAVLGERDREVQARLAAERREQRLGPLALDDLATNSGVSGST